MVKNHRGRRYIEGSCGRGLFRPCLVSGVINVNVRWVGSIAVNDIDSVEELEGR